AFRVRNSVWDLFILYIASYGRLVGVAGDGRRPRSAPTSRRRLRVTGVASGACNGVRCVQRIGPYQRVIRARSCKAQQERHQFALCDFSSLIVSPFKDASPLLRGLWLKSFRPSNAVSLTPRGSASRLVLVLHCATR